MTKIDERAVKLHTLGNMLVNEQKFNDAIVQFKKAIDIAPNYDAAIYHLAEAYEAKKLDDDAFNYYMKAIGLNNSYATIHIEAGLDSLLSGPLGKAVAEFKKQGGGAKAKAAPPPEPSPAEQEPQPAPKAHQSAQKGLAPKKFRVEAAGTLESEVATVDSITATVLGDRDLPVLDAPVRFAVVVEDKRLADGVLGADRTAASTGDKNVIVVRTDDNGKAVVFFKRSKFTGRNIVSISVSGLPEQKIDDMTVPAPVAKIVIQPARSVFTAGEKVEFTTQSADKYGNAVSGREIHGNLMIRDGADWYVSNSWVVKNDAAGKAAFNVEIPTKSGMRCRFKAINKEAPCESEIEFSLVSGKIGAVLFIPSSGKVDSGAPFGLKAKLLDEFDNPVIARKAEIIATDSSGGDWVIGEQDNAETGEDGSVFVTITPPAEPGATASFSVKADGIPPSGIKPVQFETSGTAAPAAQDSFISDPQPDAFAVAEPAFDTQPAQDAFKPFEETAPQQAPDTNFSLPDDSSDIFSGKTGQSFALPEDTPAPEADMPKGTGLDALDFDMPGDAFAQAPAEAAPAADFEPEKASEKSSVFDQLGALLDEAPEAPAPPAFDSFEPAQDTPPAADAFAVEMPLPEEDAFAAPKPAEPLHSFGSDGDFSISDEPAPQPKPPAPPAMIQIAEVVVENERLSCQVGDSVQFAVSAYDQSGQVITDGISATYRITDEPGDEQDTCFVLPDGTPVGEKVFRVQSDGSMQLPATVQAPTVPGAVTITVKCGSIAHEVYLDALPGIAEKITLSADELQLHPGDKTTIRAKIFDKFDNPLPQEEISFVVKETFGKGGMFEEPATVETDASGEASAVYVSDGNAGDRTIVGVSHKTVLDRMVKNLSIETLEPLEGQTEEQAPQPDAFAPAPEAPDAFAAPAAAPAQFDAFAQPQPDAFAQTPQDPFAQPQADAFAAPAEMGFAPAQQPFAAPAAPAFTPAPQQAFAQQPPAFQSPAPQAAFQQPYAAGGGFNMQNDQPGQPQGFPPPQQGQGVEYIPDESPDPNMQYLPGYEQQESGEYQDASTEELMQMLDPYAPPKFEIKRGKKPMMEIGELMPKIGLILLGVVLIAVALFGGKYVISDVRYQMSLNKANSYYSQNQMESARIQYENCTKIKPNEAAPYKKLGEIHYNAAESASLAKDNSRMNAEITLAVSTLNQAISLDPADPDALYDLARTYKIKGDLINTMKYVDKVLEVDPKYGSAVALKNDLIEQGVPSRTGSTRRRGL